MCRGLNCIGTENQLDKSTDYEDRTRSPDGGPDLIEIKRKLILECIGICVGRFEGNGGHEEGGNFCVAQSGSRPLFPQTFYEGQSHLRKTRGVCTLPPTKNLRWTGGRKGCDSHAKHMS